MNVASTGKVAATAAPESSLRFDAGMSGVSGPTSSRCVPVAASRTVTPSFPASAGSASAPAVAACNPAALGTGCCWPEAANGIPASASRGCATVVVALDVGVGVVGVGSGALARVRTPGTTS